MYLPLTQQHSTGEPIQQDDNLTYFKVNESIAPTKEQQDEQEYIMNTITNNNYYSGVVSMKTGRGKTHVLFRLIEQFKVPTLILCHNIKQAHETYDKICSYTNINAESNLSLITSKSNETEIKEVTITTHT
jgi:superfamily II DNA or RNA helicase